MGTDQSLTTATSTAAWRIRVDQYECDSPVLAPEGCLQYFTGIAGNVSSFNWKTTANSEDDDYPNQISSLNYNICIRRESGYCAVEWSTDSPLAEAFGEFSVSENYPTVTTLGSAVKLGDSDCAKDYVTIPQGTLASKEDSLPKDRFCGQMFGGCEDDTCNTRELGAVSSSVIPFTLGVVTDSEEPEEGNRGFRLFFKQQPCA